MHVEKSKSEESAELLVVGEEGALACEIER
jgi:hypothetical protein